MLPTRKFVPRSSRKSVNTKTSWPSQRDANWSGIDMSLVHQVWAKPSCKTQWKGKKTRQIEKGVEKQHREMDRPGFREVRDGGGEQRKMEETGCESSVVPQRSPRSRDGWRWMKVKVNEPLTNDQPGFKTLSLIFFWFFCGGVLEDRCHCMWTCCT